MNRSIAIVGAASSIGIRPYDDGGMRRLDLAPATLRDEGLAHRLRAHDLGDVSPPSYQDFTRTAGRVRNEDGVAAFSEALAARVATAGEHGAFTLVLGGDCSIVLGTLMGGRRNVQRALGLVYVDAHSDFATPATSATGSAASMCLALAAGFGESLLARLGTEPLVRGEHVVLVGRRDEGEEGFYGQDMLAGAGVTDISQSSMHGVPPAETAARILARLDTMDIGGFWIHVDADVIDPSEMRAVDSPTPGGIRLADLEELLCPLAQHPAALGLQLTIYDPALDADRRDAASLATLLERVLVP